MAVLIVGIVRVIYTRWLGKDSVDSSRRTVDRTICGRKWSRSTCISRDTAAPIVWRWLGTAMYLFSENMLHVP